MDLPPKTESLDKLPKRQTIRESLDSGFITRIRIKFWLWLLDLSFTMAVKGRRSQERYGLSNCLSKVAFNAEAECLESIEIQLKTQPHIASLYPYLCPFCDKWHKTRKRQGALN